MVLEHPLMFPVANGIIPGDIKVYLASCNACRGNEYFLWEGVNLREMSVSFL